MAFEGAGEGTKMPAIGNGRLSLTGARGYGEAVVATAVCAAASWLLDPVLGTANLGLVFLTGVLFTATRSGVLPALLASTLSFLTFTFVFTEPRYAFSISARQDLISLVCFFAVALLTGQLAARLRSKVEAEIAHNERIELLHNFTRRLYGAVATDDLASVLASYVRSALGMDAVVLMPSYTGQLAIVAGNPGRDGLTDSESRAAEWASEHGESAGAATQNLPQGVWLFLPLLGKPSRRSVLGVRLPRQRPSLDAEQSNLLFAMRDQASTALENLRLALEMEHGRLLVERDKLSSALLSSVSHDLRTPLVSIKGAASALLELNDALAPEDKRALLENLLAESERLNRYIQNLLEMTRLGYGAVTPRYDWHDVHEIVGGAIRGLKRLLGQRPIEVLLEEDATLLHTDRQLLEQVVVNLLENAAKYSPTDSAIRVEARRDGDAYLLCISDLGPGIPRAERDKVFDIFHRVNSTDQRAVGTGMGLAICKGLVEALGGRIWITDHPDTHGTRVAIRLPQPSTEPHARRADD